MHRLCQCPYQACMQLQLKLFGARSYLPLSYKLLQKIQIDVPDEYHGAVDWLLCEFRPEYQKPCFDFYAGNGPSLGQMTTRIERKILDQALHRFIVMTLFYETRRPIMKENKYIKADLNDNGGIDLFPHIENTFHPTWITYNIARMLSVREADIDFVINNTNGLSIEEAEAKVIEINTLLRELEAKNLREARAAWVARFNDL